MADERLRLLLLDDEESVRVPLTQYLSEEWGYHVDAVGTGRAALDLVHSSNGRYDVALIDQVLSPPESDGIRLMQSIRELAPNIECIVFTGWQLAERRRVSQAGAFRYIRKPFDHQELAMLIRTAAQQVRLRTISSDIIMAKDLVATLEKITASARSLALADLADLAILDHRDNSVRIRAATYDQQPDLGQLSDLECRTRETIVAQRPRTYPEPKTSSQQSATLNRSEGWNSLSIPIPGDGNFSGALHVYSKKYRALSDWGTVAVLQTLAGQAGLAIQHDSASRKIKEHTQHIEALIEVTRGLTRNHSQEDQLKLVWEYVQKQLHVSTFYIGLYNEETRVLHFPIAFENNQPLEIPDRLLSDLPHGAGISGEVIQQRLEIHWTTHEQAVEMCESLEQSWIGIGEESPTQSCFYLPLLRNERTVGVMSIQSHEPNAFSEILLDAFRALGGQVVVALENAERFANEACRRKESETLRQVSLVLSRQLGRDGLFDNILTQLQGVVPCDSASVQLLVGDCLEIIAGRGFPNLPELIGKAFPLSGSPENPNREVFASKAPVIKNDVRSDYPGFSEQPFSETEIRAWMGVPILSNGEVIGMLSLDMRQPDFYNEQHASLAQAFADQAAVTIENQQLLADANVSQMRLRSLFAASNALVSGQDPKQMLQDVVDRASQAADAAGASFVLMDEMGRAWLTVTSRTYATVDIAAVIRRDGISWRVMTTGIPQKIENVTEEADRVNPIMLELGIKAAACLPITLNGTRSGVMWIYYDQPHAISRSEIEALQFFSNQAALAYDNARRISEFRRLHEASKALASASELGSVIQQIVTSARKVLEADSSAVWSYAHAKDLVIAEDSACDGIDADVWDVFCKQGRLQGRSAKAVKREGWLGVTDVKSASDEIVSPATRTLLAQIGVCSFQGLSLQVGDETLGVLYANYRHCRHFSTQDLQVAQTYAGIAAVALKRAQLLERMKRVQRAAKVIAEISTIEELDRIMPAITASTRQALDCDAVTLFTYDEDRDQLGFPPAMDGVWNRAEVETSATPGANSIARRILELGEIHIAEDAQQDPLTQGTFVRAEAIVSSAGIPLYVSGRKVGVMFVNFRTLHRFTDDELSDIRLYAEQAAVAIHNAWLLSRASKHNQRLQAVARISQSTSVFLDQERLAHEAVDRIQEDFNFYYVGLFMLDEEKRFAVLRAGSGPVGAQLVEDGHRLAVGGRSMVGWCIKHKKQRLANCADDDNQHWPNPRLPNTKSEIVLPIVSRGDCIGALTVQSNEEQAFTRGDIVALKTMVDQLAIALENARRYEQEQHRVTLLEIFYRAGRTASDAHSLQEILDIIAEQAYEITAIRGSAASICDLELYEKGQFTRSAAFPKEHLERLRKALDDSWSQMGHRPKSITEHVARTGRAKLLANAPDDPSYFALSPDTKSELAVPILSSGTVVGVINLEHNEIGAFDREDLKNVQFLADQAAAAIVKAQLYEQSEQRAKILQAAIQTGQAITSSLSKDKILSLIAEYGWRLVNHSGSPPSFSNMALVQGSKLEPVSAYPADCALSLGDAVHRMSLDCAGQAGIMGRAVRTGKAQLVGDVMHDPDYSKYHSATRSELAVPIIRDDKVIGVINVEHCVPNAFGKQDREALELLAGQAAIAIGNAASFESLRQAKDMIAARTTVAWMGITSSTWRHAIDKHAITIEEEAGLLRNGLLKAGSSSDKRSLERIDKIERLARRIHRTPTTPPGSAEDGVGLILVNALIRERFAQLRDNETYRSPDLVWVLDLQLPSDVSVRASRLFLRTALDYIVDNAVKAVRGRPLQKITVSTQKRDNTVHIYVTDTGSGIPADILDKVGRNRVEKPEDALGMGMGLLMAQTILQAYMGELRVQHSAPDEGTTMDIAIPVAGAVL